MQLPTWLPERFRAVFTDNPPSPYTPHYDRLEALLLDPGSEMKHVWPVLEQKAKPASEVPSRVHPLDVFLMAAQADLWSTAGLGIQQAGQAAQKAKHVHKDISSLHGSLKSLLRELKTEESCNHTFFDLIRSARALDVDTKQIEEQRSEPDYLELFLKKLPELEVFFDDLCEAYGGLGKRINKKGATDRQALVLARALKNCTYTYFVSQLYPQLATTIETITVRAYDPERLKHIEVKKER